MKIQDAVNLLEEWAQYEGTELGESWQALTFLWSRIEYINNSKLVKCLKDHIIAEAESAKEEFELIEEEQTFTRTIKVLESKY